MNQPDKTNKKSKTIATIVGVIVFALVSYGVKQLLQKDIASELKDAAKELNAEAPMVIDEYTRLDSAAAVGKTKLIYYYTLKAVEKSEIDLDTMQKYMKQAVVEGFESNPEMKAFRDHDITLSYNYYDKNGELIINVETTPEDYK